MVLSGSLQLSHGLGLCKNQSYNKELKVLFLSLDFFLMIPSNFCHFHAQVFCLLTEWNRKRQVTYTWNLSFITHFGMIFSLRISISLFLFSFFVPNYITCMIVNAAKVMFANIRHTKHFFYLFICLLFLLL